MGEVINFQSKQARERAEFARHIRAMLGMKERILTDQELIEMSEENSHPALKLYQLHQRMLSLR